MNVIQIKTRKILPPKDNIEELLAYIPKLQDKSIVAISSKVVAICEGHTKPVDSVPHEELVNRLANLRLEPVKRGNNDMILTQVGNLLVESAGVDLSNANGYYVLLPRNPYKSAQEIWSFLRKRDDVKHLGIVITDSHSVPRRKGAEGFALACYGFRASHIYKNKSDIFGRKFHFTASDVTDSVAAAAVLVMGEGDERTPLALITDLDQLDYFTKKLSLRQVRAYAWVNPNLDVYTPLLNSKLWQKTS